MNTSIPAGFSLFKQDLNEIIQKTSDVHHDFENGNVFITGASGFFGIWLVEAFLWIARERRMNLTVTVLLRDTAKFFARYPHLRGNDALRWVEGDLDDFKFPDQPVSHIIHAASVPNLGGYDDWASEHICAGVIGMSRVLKLAAEKQVRALLVTSSGGVYTSVLEYQSESGFVEEVDSMAALTSEKVVYGQTKRMMEIMSAAEARKHGFKLAIARCFAFVGPYLPMNANYAIGNFIRDARAGKDIVIMGDGTPLRSYLYAADLAASLIRMLVKSRSGVPYNIAGKEVLSIKELALLVAQCHDMPTESVKVMTQVISGAPVNKYLADIDKASKEGLLCDSTSLVDAITRTSKWLDQKA
ncbi:NAD(P)-dependent oxidoreductase [Aquitalea sp. ASV15]|uniref:NAD-dependent epimerase/dehydratase family protein n=1 Tax=Aquitalea sp. ASV15 TaxID=2795104 RepID=UPI0018ED3861|nr:NAD(P)-dependent oxidoreductase [Aquitalea sp. ASV15]